MATITCHCQTTELLLSTRRPRACVECCCVDCFQKNQAAGAAPTAPALLERQRAPTLCYFENRITLVRGEVAFEKLRTTSASTNMVCCKCRTVLCVHHTGYEKKVVLVFPDWATLQHHDPTPAVLRYSIRDWSETERKRLAPLPSVWNKGDAVMGDGIAVRASVKAAQLQDCQNDGSYDSFQDLLERAKGDIEVRGLPEDPRSFCLQR